MKSNTQNEFGARIAARRREMNFTQDELASRLGVTPQALSQYERGQRLPDLELVRRLCAFLQMSADYLLNTGCSNAFEENAPMLQVMTDLQRDGILRSDEEWVEVIASRIECRDNVWVYLAERN